MLLKRLYDDMLAQASYLIGCQASGEAIVVDPNRDVEQYLRAAADEGLRITQVTETHIHADFVSGARELAARAGARLLLSGEGGTDWRYRYAESDGAKVLHNGDVIWTGNVRLDVVHTPGHTPEHVAFLLTDTAVADGPVGLLSGDFLFVGDVGRPDLLERTAQLRGTADEMARELFASLRLLRSLPDYLQIWPGHGAGSACGKSLGSTPSTTLGYERLSNWAFQIDDEDGFVREVLRGQPEPPAYFAIMKQINRDGPTPAPSRTAGLARLDAPALQKRLGSAAWVIDTRPTAQFAAASIPGTVAVPLGRSFLTYAGSVLPYDRDIVLLTESDRPSSAELAARQLSLIGIDRVVAWADAGVIDSPSRVGPRATKIDMMNAGMLARPNDGGAPRLPRIIDVRNASEWDTGHIGGALHMPLGGLALASQSLAHDEPVVLTCQSGSRSVIGASLLRKLGFSHVSSLSGGIDAWSEAGLPLEAVDQSLPKLVPIPSP